MLNMKQSVYSLTWVLIVCVVMTLSEAEDDATITTNPANGYNAIELLHADPIALAVITSAATSVVNVATTLETNMSSQLEIGETALDTNASSNLEVNEPGPDSYASSNLEVNEPGPDSHASSNLEVNEPGPDLNAQSNLEVNEAGPDLNTTSNLEAKEAGPDLNASSTLEVNEPGPDLNASSNLHVNEAGPDLNTSSNLEAQEAGLDLNGSSNFEVKEPGPNLNPSSNSEVKKSGPYLNASSKLEVNEAGPYLNASSHMEVNEIVPVTNTPFELNEAISDKKIDTGNGIANSNENQTANDLYLGETSHVNKTITDQNESIDNLVTIAQIQKAKSYRRFQDACFRADRSADVSYGGRMCNLARIAAYDFERRLKQFEKMLNMYMLGPPFSDTITMSFNKYVVKVNGLGSAFITEGEAMSELAKNLSNEVDANKVDQAGQEIVATGIDLAGIGHDNPANPKEFPDFMKQWAEEGIIVDVVNSSMAEKDMLKVLVHIEEAYTILSRSRYRLGNVTDVLRKVDTATQNALSQQIMKKLAKAISNYYESAFAEHCRIDPDVDQYADKSYAGRMCIIERHAYELEETEQYVVHTIWNDASELGFDIPGYITNTTRKRSSINKLTVEEFDAKAMEHLQKISVKFFQHGNELLEKSEKIVIAGTYLVESAKKLRGFDAKNIASAGKVTIAFGKELAEIGNDHLAVVDEIDKLQKDDHEDMLNIVDHIKREGAMFIKAGKRLAQATTILRHMSSESRQYIFDVIEELYLYGV